MTVLVLRALGLGDALTGVAALRGVRRAWPGRRVVLAAPEGVGDWFVALGLVDAVLPAHGLEPLAWPVASGDGGSELAGRGPHVAVNLHGSGPQSHRLLQATRPERLVAFASAEAGHDGPEWDPDEHEVLRWCRLVGSAGGECDPEDLRLESPGERGTHVVVHPGAASASRRWPAERWAQVVDRLAADGVPVVLTGSSGERDLCDRVARGSAASGPLPGVTSTCGALDLPDLADVVGTARLVLSGDTGVAHLATAYGTPSVTLFGPTPPATWGPVLDVERHTVVWHAEHGYRGDPHGDTLDPALERVTVDEVLDAARRLLAP